ncbi:alpha-ribazole phosphatase [Desulfallas thermosapovorans]|uniref:Alpha-ribazole phosphatase n=1 Tax=Desulfallas thermosapovorans DSM 6562 TaxID=1121431 RepID=A0A5S5A002_9FIRM|nr:alpha-ribazole phosphatase [Desulfallas thermosapovorans]TYO97840.1 alpha-ribazole phosphatase/probable phosphoglycerate mutase [Desulfallas thermosapovorans DSM 6562]
MGSRLFLVRHGETVWNKETRLQGRADIALSDKGIKQAEALSKRLAGHNFAAFYSSNLSRARETAAIIARPHRKPVQEIPDLQELNFGHWEGLTIEEIRRKYRRESEAWWSNPLETRIPGGETLAEMTERSVRAVKNIVEQYPDEQVLVVVHGGVIRSIVATVLGIDLNQYWRLRQDNASLTIIDFYQWDKAILMLYNDCSHLAPGQVPPV